LYQHKNENVIYEVCGRVNFWLCNNNDTDIAGKSVTFV